MEALKNLPIGIQSFESLRKGGYLYVDKTALVYQLVTTGKYYFMSRPRRFGKSMLLSTLHAYFEGKKELFEGLAISDLEKEWIKYPVLHLDLNSGDYTDVKVLNSNLNVTLSSWEDRYGSNPVEDTFSTRFEGVIRRAYKQSGQKVVILVDEYEKPILQAIDNEELQTRYREILKGFYTVLKSLDEYIQFAFLTGVTKINKISVFSGINNIEDISLDEDYATICGITDEEIDTVFTPYVERLAKRYGSDMESTREELRKYYDGYHFANESTAVYNPFSLLNALKKRKFDNYWFETGTPTYLIRLLQTDNCNIADIASAEVSDRMIGSVNEKNTTAVTILYQSGYLTIKGFDQRFGIYSLGFPNKEVEESFLDSLMPYYVSLKNSDSGTAIKRFVQDVEGGNVEGFMRYLSGFFADTPYELVKDLENHYQNVLFIITKLMGFYVKAEYHTSAGRIDMVLQTDDYTYVMEFKLDGTAEDALAQINDKSYTLPFENGDRKLVKVGVNFSKETRNIEKWIVE
jgi:hypothetical protein